MVTVLTKENYDAEVMSSDKPVMIDFWASWCGPCMMVSPIIDEIAEENSDIKVCKVNVDEQPELAAEFNIDSIPTIVVIKNGKVTASATGSRPKQRILNLLNE